MSDIRADLNDQSERAVTALERCQMQRDEIRAERDAALAEVARLRREIDVMASPVLTIEQINALPEVAGKFWSCGSNDAFVRVLKATMTEQRRQIAARVESILNPA